MNGLELEYGDRITFYRLDADDPENAAFQQGLGLRGHPTVALLDANGKVAARFIGQQTAETLRPALDALVAPP